MNWKGYGSVHNISGYLVGIGVQWQSAGIIRQDGRCSSRDLNRQERSEHTRGVLSHSARSHTGLYYFFLGEGGREEVIYYLRLWRYLRKTGSNGCVSLGEVIWLGDWYLCKNTVTVPATDVLTADVLGTGIFHWQSAIKQELVSYCAPLLFATSFPHFSGRSFGINRKE
jgi:hypothetical protein